VCLWLVSPLVPNSKELSKKIISKILKVYADELSSDSIPLKDTAVLSSISKAKAKGLSPRQFGAAKPFPDPIQQMIARIYADYTAVLKESNSLDFDDLLVFGVRLFTKYPGTVTWCRHILVDELWVYICILDPQDCVQFTIFG